MHCQSHTESNDSWKQSWQQPPSLSKRFPELISTRHWQFEFTPVEQGLRSIKRDNAGKLILNASTTKVLKSIVSTMPKNMEKEALERVALLINKSFPNTFNQSLAALFVNFYKYQQASHFALTKSSTKRPEQQFREDMTRQKNYLTEEIAEQLFGRQNTVNNYLYARKLINESDHLTLEQKQQQLSGLQRRFKEYDK